MKSSLCGVLALLVGCSSSPLYVPNPSEKDVYINLTPQENRQPLHRPPPFYETYESLGALLDMYRYTTRLRSWVSEQKELGTEYLFLETGHDLFYWLTALEYRLTARIESSYITNNGKDEPVDEHALENLRKQTLEQNHLNPVITIRQEIRRIARPAYRYYRMRSEKDPHSAQSWLQFIPGLDQVILGADYWEEL